MIAVDITPTTPQDRLGRLSRREADVLIALTHGQSPQEIADAQYVSITTVRTQLQGIRTKLEVGSLHAAVALAFRAGWVTS